MKWLLGIATVAGCAALGAGALWLSANFSPPWPLGIFTQTAAIGVPVYIATLLTYRQKLPFPVAWGTAAYCLASGIFISYNMGAGEPVARYVQVALVHAVSLTVLAPAVGGGYLPLWGDLVWVVLAAFIAMYALEAAGGKKKPAVPTAES